MPSDGDDQRNSWIELGPLLIWTVLLIGSCVTLYRPAGADWESRILSHRYFEAMPTILTHDPMIGLLLGVFAGSLSLVRSTLIAALGLFFLLFLWRIDRGVEHLAYDS